jgi:hypothetical protein
MPRPVPLQSVPAMQAAVALDQVPEPSAAQSTEPLFPMCVACGNRRDLAPRGQERYASGARVLACRNGCQISPVQAATGVITAAMTNGAGTPQEWAQAEEDAGLLFDPQRARDIEAAAREQALAEVDAELRHARDAIQSRDWFHERWLALQRLTYGRPDTDLMLVREILAATDPGRATTAPHSLTWDGLVSGPSGDVEGEHTLVPLTTEHGAQAVLALTDEQRLQLGGKLLATLHTAEVCATPGCGLAADEIDEVDPPALFSWIRIEVLGTEDGPRWWCSPWCASSAMTAAAAELAAADQAATVDPDAQIPYLPVARAVEDVAEDEARCHRCGCTENTPCAGGCHWVPNAGLVDLCSRCAHPEDVTPEPMPGGAR